MTTMQFISLFISIARKDPLVTSGLGMRGSSALPKTFAEAKRNRVPRTRHISDEVCAYKL